MQGEYRGLRVGNMSFKKKNLSFLSFTFFNILITLCGCYFGRNDGWVPSLYLSPADCHSSWSLAGISLIQEEEWGQSRMVEIAFTLF